MPGLRDKSIVFEKNSSVPPAPTGSEVLLFSDVNGNLVVKQSSGAVNVLAITGAFVDTTTVASLTGNLQIQIDGQQITLSELTSVSGTGGITSSEVASLTGNLQTQITANNVVDDGQQTVLSQLTSLSGSFATRTLVASLTGSLQTQISAIQAIDVGQQFTLSQLASVTGSFATNVVVGSLTGSLNARLTDVELNNAVQSSNIQNLSSAVASITVPSVTGFATLSTVASLTGSLKSSITDIELNNAIQSSNIQSISANYATTSAVNSLTGSLQTQITSINTINDAQQTTLSQLTSVSGGSGITSAAVASLTGNLQSQITTIGFSITGQQSTLSQLTSVTGSFATLTAVNSLTGSLQTQITAIQSVDIAQQSTLSQLTSVSGSFALTTVVASLTGNLQTQINNNVIVDTDQQTSISRLSAISGSPLGWTRTLQEFSAPNTLIGGYTWASRTSAADNIWLSVCHGNGLFVAISSDGTSNHIMTSPDGVTWTLRTSATDLQWQSVCYGRGTFVAVALTGTGNRVMTSFDGITWDPQTSAADSSWSSVCYGNGLFVAVSFGTSIMTSPDGFTWTLRSAPFSKSWRSVCYGNGRYVAVNSNNTSSSIMFSLDGFKWVQAATPIDRAWYSVCYGNGKFVAVADSASDGVLVSNDGFIWTAATPASTSQWRSVCFGNGLFVATNFAGVTNGVMTSPNGINWTLRALPVVQTWTSVCYGNGVFVAVSQSGTGNRVMTSGGLLTFLGDFTSSRNLTVPDASFTLAGQDYTNTFSAPQIVDLSTGTSSVSSYPSATQSGITLLGGITGASSPTVRGAAWNATSLALIGQGASGTRVSPSGMADGIGFVNILAYGHNGTAYTTSPAGRYQLSAHGNWTSSNTGLFHIWTGTPSGSTTAAEWMRLQNGGLCIGGTAPISATSKLNVYGTSLFDTSPGSGTLPTAVVPNSIQLGASDTSQNRIEGVSFLGAGINVIGRVAGGTRASPTSTPTDSIFFQSGSFGYTNTWDLGNAGYTRIAAGSLWSASNKETYHNWGGTPNGSLAVSEWMRLQNGCLGIGIAPITGAGTLQITGSALIDMGVGTLPPLVNAAATSLRIADGRINEYISYGQTGIARIIRCADGTRASPLPVINTRAFFVDQPNGWDGTTWVSAANTYGVFADGQWSTTNRGVYHDWGGVSNGSIAATAWMRLQNGNLGIGTVPITGSGLLQLDKGTGTLPAPTNSSRLITTIGVADGVGPLIEAFSFAGGGFSLRPRIADGTRASPLGAINDAVILDITPSVYDGTTWRNNTGRLVLACDGLQSSTNRGTYWAFTGTSNGSITTPEWMRLQNGNVGIGVAPITGQGALQIVSAGQGARITAGNNSGALDFYVTNAGTAGSRNLRILPFVGSGAGTERYEFQRITDAGVYSGSLLGIGVGGQACPFAFAGGILIGTTDPNGATAGNGYLQLTSGTTKAAGIAFGTDTFLFRNSAGGLTVGGQNALASLVADGSNSGTAGGGAIGVKNNGTSVVLIGNYSNINGGAYDATASILAASDLSIGVSGAARFFRITATTMGLFGNTPVAQATGFGTPTNITRVASFPGTSATLAQCGGQIADIITYLKSRGDFGA